VAPGNPESRFFVFYFAETIRACRKGQPQSVSLRDLQLTRPHTQAIRFCCAPFSHARCESPAALPKASPPQPFLYVQRAEEQTLPALPKRFAPTQPHSARQLLL